MEKDKNLTNLLYKTAQNGPKLRTLVQAQILKKLRTVEAHSIFTGSYRKKSLGSESESDSDSTLLGFGFGLAGL